MSRSDKRGPSPAEERAPQCETLDVPFEFDENKLILCRAGASPSRASLGCDKHTNVTQEFFVAVKTLLNIIFLRREQAPRPTILSPPYGFN